MQTGFVLIVMMSLSTMVAVCVCSFAPSIGRRLSLVDNPGRPLSRKRHTSPTPLVGGLAIIPASLVAMVVLASGLSQQIAFAVLAAVTGGMLLLGVLDDRHNLSARHRLVISALLIFSVVAAFPEFRMDSLRFSFLDPALDIGWAGGVLLTGIAVLGFQNAVNMADGKNGLVTGLSLIWCLLLMFHAPSVVQETLMVLACGLAAVFAFNIRGRIFLGDGGSYSISVLLAFLSLYSFNAPAGAALSSDMLILFFWIPVLDTLRLIWMRLARKRTPFQPDRRHLHHFLSDALPWPGGLSVYLASVGLPGAVALMLPELTGLLLVGSTVIYVLILGYCARKIRRRIAARSVSRQVQKGKLYFFAGRRSSQPAAQDYATGADRRFAERKIALRKVV